MGDLSLFSLDLHTGFNIDIVRGNSMLITTSFAADTTYNTV